MSEAVPPPLPAKARGTWWQRYWIWVAIFGGLALLAGTVFGTMGLMHFVGGKLRSSEPYRVGLAAAQDDTAVTEALGSPITATNQIGGFFNESSRFSVINLTAQISGPKGLGTLQVAATKTDDEWTYTTLQVFVVDTKKTIPLKKSKPAAE